jgi:formylmethanofuran dehydrogenase subunit C
MNHRLVLREPPRLRIDARQLAPAVLGLLTAEEVQRLRLPHGREHLVVGDLFDVRPGPEGNTLRVDIEGDLSRFDAVGAGLAGHTLQVQGPVGDSAGLGMTGGRLVIHGNAGDLTGCAMRGGWLEVMGDTGDLAASGLPGSMEGMAGGALVVRGRAGDRTADRLRRGSVVVCGDVGDFAGSRMVAGTLAVGGRAAGHPGWGMRRGSLLLAGTKPEMPSTFVPVPSQADVFWQLFARDLAWFGGSFADLPRRRVERWAGDLAVQGKGELLFLG